MHRLDVGVVVGIPILDSHPEGVAFLPALGTVIRDAGEYAIRVVAVEPGDHGGVAEDEVRPACRLVPRATTWRPTVWLAGVREGIRKHRRVNYPRNPLCSNCRQALKGWRPISKRHQKEASPTRIVDAHTGFARRPQSHRRRNS